METMCKTPSKTLFYLQHSCPRMEWCYVNDAFEGIFVLLDYLRYVSSVTTVSNLFWCKGKCLTV